MLDLLVKGGEKVHFGAVCCKIGFFVITRLKNHGMNFKSTVQVILLRETHLLNKMGLSRTKINLKTIRHAKHILSQTGLGKFEKILPNRFLY